MCLKYPCRTCTPRNDSTAAFLKKCAMQDTASDCCHRPNQKCKPAISLISGCTSLISTLCRSSEVNHDDLASVLHFKNHNGERHISLVQRVKLRSVPFMLNSDTLALSDSDCSCATNSSLPKIYRDFQTAIQTIETPNVHRLYDLANTPLPVSCMYSG